ncbi:MAG TPA: serine protease [Candidatus Competibacteraceae bacterium]|nr:serine protease [Candidatus Competibacteraceae bacterium]
MDWGDAVDILAKYLLRISTPVAVGSGFLLSWPSETQLFAVASAAHVIDHAHHWEEPIRLEHPASGQSLLLHPPQRAVFLDEQRDTAILLFEQPDLPFRLPPLELAPRGQYLRVGTEVGWLGFPAIANACCFFSGRVSAWREEEESYLIDGVAINGVSGGPAFFLMPERPVVIGVVAAYMPNRLTGEVLPGLAVVRDVSQFYEVAPQFRSIDEARLRQTRPAEPPAARK